MPYKVIILLSYILLTYSCKKENRCDCIKSTGAIIMTDRNAINFTSIRLQDKMDVYITQGTHFEVKVEAGKNLQDLIKTQLNGDTLVLLNDNRCNWVRGYKHKISIYITAPYFKHIIQNGMGALISNGIIEQDIISFRSGNSGDLKLNIKTKICLGSSHGNGDTYLSGTTDRMNLDYKGTNYLYAGDLTILSYLYLHSVTLGATYINAPENGLMDVILDASGNVYYTGNPATIRLTKNSKGNLFKQ